MTHNNPIPLTKYDLPLLSQCLVAEKTDGIRFTLHINGTTTNVPGLHSAIKCKTSLDCEKVGSTIYVFDILSQEDNTAHVSDLCAQCFGTPCFQTYDEYFAYIQTDI